MFFLNSFHFYACEYIFRWRLFFCFVLIFLSSIFSPTVVKLELDVDAKVISSFFFNAEEIKSQIGQSDNWLEFQSLSFLFSIEWLIIIYLHVWGRTMKWKWFLIWKIGFKIFYFWQIIPSSHLSFTQIYSMIIHFDWCESFWVYCFFFFCYLKSHRINGNLIRTNRVPYRGNAAL